MAVDPTCPIHKTLPPERMRRLPKLSHALPDTSPCLVFRKLPAFRDKVAEEAVRTDMDGGDIRTVT